MFGEFELPGLIGVDCFTGLTAAQEGFLAAASGQSEVCVCLTYDPEVPATVSARELVERLAAYGSEERAVSDGPPGNRELQRVEREFGRAGASPTGEIGSVILSEAWGEAAEAARIAREVQDAIADGTKPGAIAVVFRDAAPHIYELRLAFEEAGIAAEFDARVPFHLTGLGRVLLTLLSFGAEGTTHGQLMDVLRSPYSPADDATLDAVDAHVRRSTAVSPRFVERWMRGQQPEAAAFLRDVRRACADVSGPEAENMWYRLVSGMLRRARLGVVSSDSEVLLDAAAARVFLQAVQGLSALHEGAPDPRVLEAALREARVAVGSEDDADCVQVMGAERVRGRRYECVIMAGLTASELPRRVGDDALSAPGVAGVLQRYGIDASPRVGTDEERLLFYQAVTRASTRLVLSWQSHDFSGCPVRPSIFLEEMLDLYRDPVSGDFFVGEPPRRFLGLDAQENHPAAPLSVRRSARSCAGGAEVGDTGSLQEARRRATRPRTPISDGVKRAMDGREVFSASEIEVYLQCPFRWYVQRLVQPRELDESVDSAAVGRLAHEIMRQFYEVLEARTGHRRVGPEILEAARELHGEVSASALSVVGSASAAEEAAARATARRTLRLVEADARLLSGFEPTFREWSFGISEGDSPEPLGSFSLAGRIDRIDVDERRLVVTDYKLGTVDQRRAVAAFEAEGLVQLPLYALVAGRRLGLDVAGAVYRSVSGTKPRGFVREDLASSDFVRTDVVTAADVEALTSAAVERASKAVAGMRSGDIRPEPLGGTCPSYCPARGFCSEWRPGRA